MMTRRRWMVFAALVAALCVLQRFGLDSQPETLEEDRYRRVPDVRASDIIPTYIASLFFGAFRAVAVDVLWIQLKTLEEEKRWYERREILQLIAYFQPRNPEVWSHLGWHSAYNVANGFTDPEKSWEWVKFGLEWLRRGNRMLPDSPHLKEELAFTLFHKPSWRDGRFDLPLMRRIEEDTELQKLLQDGKPIERRLSAFELAIPWLEKARDELFAAREGHKLTHMGRYLYPSSEDGFIRRCMYLQGMYAWRQEKREEAKSWFRRAHRHCQEMLSKRYPETISPIYADWVKLYAALPEIVDLDLKARGGRPEDEHACLAAVQQMILDVGPIDEGFLWLREFPGPATTLLNILKQKAAKGQDFQEFNDSFDTATDLRAGDLALANLDPEGLDVDYYWVIVPGSGKSEEANPRPPRPIPVQFLFNQGIESGPLELKVTIFDAARRPMKEIRVRGRSQIGFEAETYGLYFVKVEPSGPVSVWPGNTRYAFQYTLGE